MGTAAKAIFLSLLILLCSCSSGSNSPPTGSDGSSGDGGDGASQDVAAVVITQPATGTQVDEGDTVSLTGEGEGANGEVLEGDALVWTDAGGSELGTGTTVTTGPLSAGQHTFALTGTDAGGNSDTVTVTVVVIAAQEEPPPRFGEKNPLIGELRRLPVKRDDELLVIGRGTAGDPALDLGLIADPIGFYETTSTGEPVLPSEPVSPESMISRAGSVPLAAAAGRVLDSNLHQVALLSADTSTGGFDTPLLEVVGINAGESYPVGSYQFDAPFEAGPVAMVVADLDAFDEESGAVARTRPSDAESRYYGEVAVAYPAPDGGETRAAVRVLSFEDVVPEAGATEGAAPTSIVSALATRPMLPGGKIVLHYGENLTSEVSGPHLLLAYLDTSGQIAIDVFKYERVRIDPELGAAATDMRQLASIDVLADDPFTDYLVVSDALEASTAAAGGWDVELVTGSQLGSPDNGLSNSDLINVVWNESGRFTQSVWSLESADGMADPNRIVSDANIALGSFALVPGGSEIVELTILPDSSLQLAAGRVAKNTGTGFRCEAIGLYLLADTDRGAVVQALEASGLDASMGGGSLGPITDLPTWPAVADLRDRPATAVPTQTSIAGGGFVFDRNALIDERGEQWNGFQYEYEYAEDCSDTNTAPYLGPMASIYIADPAAAELISVTVNLNSSAGRERIVAAPLGVSGDLAPLLVASDVDGNAGYYSSSRCIYEDDITGSTAGFPADCRRIYLSDAELYYSLEEIETQSVVLQQPPKHIDYLPALGGLVDVSMTSAYYAEFSQTDTVSGSIRQNNKTSWTVGGRAGVAVGAPAPPGKSFTPLGQLHIEAEVSAITESFDASEVTVSLTQTTGAVDDDVIWSRVQTVDFWRFPAQGGKEIGNASEPSDFEPDAFADISIPGDPVTLIGPGVLNDNYQPNHQVGNILTYPAFSGDVQDLGELFGYLGNYVPSGPDGTRQCMPVDTLDQAGCMIRNANGLLHRVTEVHPDDDFVGGQFISRTNAVDVAEILQVGGITYSASLEFSEEVQNGQSVTYQGSIGAEISGKRPIRVRAKGIPVQVAQLESEARASASIESALISENSMGSRASISLHVPSGIPVERSYRIRPSFGYTPEGTLKVSYQVSTDGTAADFWQAHYAAPDPALNLPHRIVRTAGGYELGTDFSRNRLRGVSIRNGEDVDPSNPGSSIGPFIAGAPSAGQAVQLEVLVYNLSLGTPVAGLPVRFEARAYENGKPTGEPIRLGESTIDYLPYRGEFSDLPEGHVGRAYFVWDTTGFGPLAGDSLKSWVVYVTLDPDDQIPDETHELNDRYADPLLSSTGDAIDADLEKGQNNRGWFLVRVAPPLTDDSIAQAKTTSGAGFGKSVSGFSEPQQVTLSIGRRDADGDESFVEARVNETVELRVGIDAGIASRESGQLRVFDGDPAEDGSVMIVSRTVQGLSATGTIFEDFVWVPSAAGPHALVVEYEANDAGVSQTLRAPARVSD